MHKALGYDRLAASYHRIEWLVFGNQLQRARVALIDQLPNWHRLLILGDGDGRLLEQLYVHRRACEQRHALSPQPIEEQYRPWSITSVDHSLAMLRRQQLRLAATTSSGAAADAHGGTVRFEHIDALSYTPEAKAYDAIVTPFFLDCFSHAELAERLPIWLSGLCSDGAYLHVDFISPRSVWQRPRARALLWAMHVFFRWQTGLTNRRLVDSQSIIKQCGLCKATEHISGRGMIAAQIWRFGTAR